MKKMFERTKPYNQLPMLPPREDIVDKDVLLEWGLASRNLAELNKNLYRLPNPAMLINTLTLQEARSSSEIENIFTTDDELYKAVSDSLKEENASPNTKEVLRYREALWAGYNNIQNNRGITLDTILNVYQKIKNTTQEIRSLQSRVVIRRGNSELRAGEIIYTPPRGESILKELINNFVMYLADNKDNNIDPLIKMAIAHYQFEAIHPFSDGNGRTGRIINLLYLVKENLLTQPVLYLSKYIIENKDDYYFKLGAVTQRGDWKPWLLYMMKAVQYTAFYTNHLIDDIVLQMDATLEYGKQNLKWYNKDVNEVLFMQPYVKPKLLGDVLERSSRTTLTKYMQEMTDLGILSPKKEGKEVFYLNNDLIRILEG
ncbi:MAG: Fic family protein [Bacteroidales bacterium]|nr:Fic family protein [Bacteroidales bacterium]